MVRAIAMQFAADSDEESATEAKSKVDHALAKLEPTMRAQLPKLFEAYAQAYAREFSDSELRDMIAFASTSGGKHYLAHREFVLGDPSVVQAQQEMNEAMKPALFELQKEACAEHTAQRIAAGDKNAKCALADKADVKQG
jgi:hypothetical protein